MSNPLTLEDALNRNYYFYNGSGEIRNGFVAEVFRKFLGYNYDGYINRIIKKGGSRENAQKQAMETALRGCEAIIRYRKEIKEHFAKTPGLRGSTTDERIDTMLYTELKDLRTHLGLNKRGKKVTKTEPAPAKTVSQAKEALNKSKTSEVAARIIVRSEDDEPEDYYTTEEAMEAYEGYTNQELSRMGIHVTDAYDEIPFDAEAARYDMISDILSLNITINGEEINPNDLLRLEETELTKLHKQLTAATATLDSIKKGHTKK